MIFASLNQWEAGRTEGCIYFILFHPVFLPFNVAFLSISESAFPNFKHNGSKQLGRAWVLFKVLKHVIICGWGGNLKFHVLFNENCPGHGGWSLFSMEHVLSFHWSINTWLSLRQLFQRGVRHTATVKLGEQPRKKKTKNLCSWNLVWFSPHWYGLVS